MIAAERLSQLLASSPSMPNTEALVRWWKTTKELIPQLLDVIGRANVALSEAGVPPCDEDDHELFVDERIRWLRQRVGAHMQDVADLQAELERERTQHRSNVEGFESALATEAHEKSILEQVESELRAQLEIVRPRDEVLAEGFWRSCSGCHELNEGHPTGPYSEVFRCNLGSGCRECGGIGATWEPGHPASWLDCPECKARSKSGAKPPRCEEFVAMEAIRG